MNKAKLVRELRTLLDNSDNTAVFLQGVTEAVERLYAESDSECPEGFAALDQAVAAFERLESEE